MATFLCVSEVRSCNYNVIVPFMGIDENYKIARVINQNTRVENISNNQSNHHYYYFYKYLASYLNY